MPSPEPYTETSLSPGVYRGPVEITEDGASLIGSCDANGTPLSIIEGGVEVRASHVEVACVEVRGSGISVVGPGIQDILIRDFVTRDTFSSGIAIWGTRGNSVPAGYTWDGVRDVRVLRGEVVNAVDGGWHEKITIAYGVVGCEVAGVWMYDDRELDGSNGGQGLDLKEGVQDCRIHHNDLGPVHRSSALYIDGGNGWNADSAPVHRNIEFDHNRVHDDSGALMISTEGRGGIDGLHVHHNEVVSDGHFGIILYENKNAPRWAAEYGAEPGLITNVRIEQNHTRGDKKGLRVDNPRATGIVIRDNNTQGLSVGREPVEWTAANNNEGVAVARGGVGLEGIDALYRRSRSTSAPALRSVRGVPLKRDRAPGRR